MSSIKRTKCRHCERLFIPDAGNKGRQKYCHRPACRKVSKADSQQNWLSKEENKNYFKGPVDVLWVQGWRKNNPCYSRMMYVEFAVSQNMEHFLACQQNAFRFFGGVPARVMVDLKSALKRTMGQGPVCNTGQA